MWRPLAWRLADRNGKPEKQFQKKPILTGAPYRVPQQKITEKRQISSSESSSDSDCDFSYPKLRTHIQFTRTQNTDTVAPIRPMCFRSRVTQEWSDDETPKRNPASSEKVKQSYPKPELVSGPFVREEPVVSQKPERFFSSSSSSSDESDAIILDRRCSAKSVKFCGELPRSPQAQQKTPVTSILKSPQKRTRSIEVQEGSDLQFDDDSCEEDAFPQKPVVSRFTAQRTPARATPLSHFVTPKSSDAPGKL